MKPRIVLTTIDSSRRARKLAKQLVTERLAACVNIVPQVHSVYRWRGAVDESKELLLIIKSSHHRLRALTARIRELHPYDTPEVLSLQPSTVAPWFHTWWAESLNREHPLTSGAQRRKHSGGTGSAA